MPYPRMGTSRVESWTRITEFVAPCLLLSAALVFPACSQPLTAFTGQHFNGLPPPIPSFVYYRGSQPQNSQKLLFSPIHTPYKQYIISRNLAENIQPTSNPGPVKLSVASTEFSPQKQSGYEIREINSFATHNRNEFSITPTYNNLVPAIHPGIGHQRANGLPTSSSHNYASSTSFLQTLRQSNSPLSQQLSSLRYASNFRQPSNQGDELQKALTSLSPTVQQRQRSVASAGELVYRQQTAGAKPFLSANSDGVQREGGEELSSPGGFLGQPYRRPTFVSAVGTPVSGVGQNPLYTGDSVQASKLDEASDVRGVKSPGGIPAPGRLPVRQDAYFSRPASSYANNFGYSIREDPVFNSLAPSLVAASGPFLLTPQAYQRSVRNR
ncbi:uncharacterized protein [Hetaerina americana]|uniref:uncharacterized protein n=1 Tax=Hetaerina americana TaxID=62018 RepID=UPI003A7F56AE